MPVYISDKDGNLKLVAGKYTKIETAAVMSTRSANSSETDGEYLVADITFGEASTMRITDGLDIVMSDGSYDIIVEFPVTTDNDPISVNFNNRTYLKNTFSVLTTASSSAGSTTTQTALIDGSYTFRPGYQSPFLPSTLKIHTTVVGGMLMFQTSCTWMPNSTTLNHLEWFGNCENIGTLTGFEMFVNMAYAKGTRLRIYKRPTNAAAITSGESYTEK